MNTNETQLVQEYPKWGEVNKWFANMELCVPVIFDMADYCRIRSAISNVRFTGEHTFTLRQNHDGTCTVTRTK